MHGKTTIKKNEGIHFNFMHEHESENLVCESVLYSEKQYSGNFQSQGPNRIFDQKFPNHQPQETISPWLRRVGCAANLPFPFSAKL
jgi:hypothetical protein